MIGCFIGPFLLLEMALLVTIFSAMVDFSIILKSKAKGEQNEKTFIQDGLRKVLAQTMVPLPTGM